MSETHHFLRSAGATISLTKSCHFASDPGLRKQLRLLTWETGDQDDGVQVPVILAGRSLGAHVDYTWRSTGTTLNERIRRTIPVLWRLTLIRAPSHVKAFAALTKAHSRALYGCQTIQVGDCTMAAYLAAAARALEQRTASQRAPALLFAAVSSKPQLDPRVAVLLQRVVELRRQLAKQPRLAELVAVSVRKYMALNYVGTEAYLAHHGLELTTLQPQPPLGVKGRDAWRPPLRPQGPMGVLLCQLHSMGAILSYDWRLLANGLAPMQVLHHPRQHLCRQLGRWAQESLCQEVLQRRAGTSGTHRVDWMLTRTAWHCGRACDHASPDQPAPDGERDPAPTPDPATGVAHLLWSGGFWTGAALHRAGLQDDPACPHCGAPLEDARHRLWDCPRLAELRCSHGLEHPAWPDALPGDLALLGLAPQLFLAPGLTYWGTKVDPGHSALAPSLGAAEPCLQPTTLTALAEARADLRSANEVLHSLVGPTYLAEQDLAHCGPPPGGTAARRRPS